jgi:tyrosinase
MFVRRIMPPTEVDNPIISFYASAVAEMKARRPSDPTSWSYQAAMHGTTEVPPPKLANGCQHAQWYFLSWHRMYVYYFERIVRAIVIHQGGPSDWALPYWNYGQNGIYAALPVAFRPPGLPELFVSQRSAGMNRGDQMPPQVTSSAFALARPTFIGGTEFGGGISSPIQFDSATGRIEQTPHNDVHNTVGGFMQNPFTAALDPIFWLHHANIDRLWAVWNAMGGTRTNPVDDARWAGQSFSFFDADGKEVSLTGRQVSDTRALDYTYDSLPAAPLQQREVTVAASDVPPEPEPEIVGASEEPVRLVGSPAHVSVAVDQRARSALLGAAAPRRVVLSIDNIEADTNPGTVYGVYVNLPEGAPPEVEALHHVGNASFFGIERARDPRGDEHGHGLRVAMDITDLVRSLAASGMWEEQHVDVVFRPLRLIPADETETPTAETVDEDPPVSIGRVSVFYA